ncbi:MAG: hypothetical protein Q9212_003171 [Teloschistes hypoglaucus]
MAFRRGVLEPGLSVAPVSTISRPTATTAPKGSISIGTPSVTASASIPPTGTGVNARNDTVNIVNSTVIPVVSVAVAIVVGLMLFRRRRKKLRRTEKSLERSGEAEASPFLQMKPELDALQQRFELDTTPKGLCELEGQSSRQEMMTQADEENRVTRHVQELRS